MQGTTYWTIAIQWAATFWLDLSRPEGVGAIKTLFKSPWPFSQPRLPFGNVGVVLTQSRLHLTVSATLPAPDPNTVQCAAIVENVRAFFQRELNFIYRVSQPASSFSYLGRIVLNLYKAPTKKNRVTHLKIEPIITYQLCGAFESKF